MCRLPRWKWVASNVWLKRAGGRNGVVRRSLGELAWAAALSCLDASMHRAQRHAQRQQKQIFPDDGSDGDIAGRRERRSRRDILDATTNNLQRETIPGERLRCERRVTHIHPEVVDAPPFTTLAGLADGEIATHARPGTSISR